MQGYGDSGDAEEVWGLLHKYSNANKTLSKYFPKHIICERIKFVKN